MSRITPMWSTLILPRTNICKVEYMISKVPKGLQVKNTSIEITKLFDTQATPYFTLDHKIRVVKSNHKNRALMWITPL
jgi:hypothetical protein